MYILQLFPVVCGGSMNCLFFFFLSILIAELLNNLLCHSSKDTVLDYKNAVKMPCNQ